MSRASPVVLLAFAAMVFIGGTNFVAVRVSNEGLPPFYGAAVRFALAAALFGAFVLATRVPLPRGSALGGAVLYGLLGFAASYALMYWALLSVGAGFASVVLSLTPLLTVFFALGHGIERFRWRGLAGALVAVAGTAVVFADRLRGSAEALPLLAMVLAAGCIAESSVLLKRFPRAHPAATNAVGMATGAAALAVVSLAAGEWWGHPGITRTYFGVLWLVLPGSIGLFGLFLFVLSRWTASATSYGMVLMPLVAIPLGALLAGELVTPTFLAGGALVGAGVWIGALWQDRSAPASPRPESPPVPTGPKGS